MDRLIAAAASLYPWSTTIQTIPPAPPTDNAPPTSGESQHLIHTLDPEDAELVVVNLGNPGTQQSESSSTTPADTLHGTPASSRLNDKANNIESPIESRPSSTTSPNAALTPKPPQTPSNAVGSTSSARVAPRTSLYDEKFLYNPLIPKNVQTALKAFNEKFMSGKKVDREDVKKTILLIAQATLTSDQKQLYADPVLRVGQNTEQAEDPLSQAKTKEIRARIRVLDTTNIENDINTLFEKAASTLAPQHDGTKKKK